MSEQQPPAGGGTQADPSGEEPGPDAPKPWMPPNARTTPNAEKYLLEADALRRRQLRSALLHGSSRTWRDNARIWPAIIAGLVVVAIIIGVLGVMNAIQDTREEQQQQQRQEQKQQQQLQQEQRKQQKQQEQEHQQHPGKQQKQSGKNRQHNRKNPQRTGTQHKHESGSR